MGLPGAACRPEQGWLSRRVAQVASRAKRRVASRGASRGSATRPDSANPGSAPSRMSRTDLGGTRAKGCGRSLSMPGRGKAGGGAGPAGGAGNCGPIPAPTSNDSPAVGGGPPVRTPALRCRMDCAGAWASRGQSRPAVCRRGKGRPSSQRQKALEGKRHQLRTRPGCWRAKAVPGANGRREGEGARRR